MAETGECASHTPGYLADAASAWFRLMRKGLSLQIRLYEIDLIDKPALEEGEN